MTAGVTVCSGAMAPSRASADKRGMSDPRWRGVSPTTIIATQAEEFLKGKAPSEELFAQAGEIAKEDCSPLPDGRGPVDYKRHLASVLTTRALRRATARALHQEAN